MKPRLFFLPLLLLSVGACSQQYSQAEPTTQEQTMQTKTEQITGTLLYKDMEGGFYGFEGDNGNKYTLRNLAPEYKKNGIKLQVSGWIREDIMTFTQFGSMFEVESVKILDESTVKPKNNEY